MTLIVGLPLRLTSFWIISFQILYFLQGTGHATKSDEFSEKIQTTFWENNIAFFLAIVRKKPFIKVQNLQYKFLD